MEKNSKIRYIILFVVILFIANILHWVIIGIGSSYHVAVKQLEEDNLNTFSTHSTIDTLVILEDRESQYNKKFRIYIDDASDRRIKKITSDIQEFKGINAINVLKSDQYYKDKRWKPVFDFSILRIIPLYCNIETEFVHGDASNRYEGYYIYFFSWIKLKTIVTGMS